MEIKYLLREKSLAESTAEYIQVILELHQKVQELEKENAGLKVELTQMHEQVEN